MKDYKILFQIGFFIGEKAHEGQLRNDRITKYFVHPRQVADCFESYLDKTIGILHDVVEDCEGYTIDVIRSMFNVELEDQGFDPFEYFGGIEYILDGVDAMTFDPKKFKTKREYLENIIAKGYTNIKIADITCNLADDPTPYQCTKYRRYIKILIGGKKAMRAF